MTKRTTNIEVLRIVAMLMVMLIHSGFMSFGVPTASDMMEKPYLSSLIFSNMSLSTPCVNIFILISGWFGIKMKPNKIATLVFQTYFFSAICTCIYLSITKKGISSDILFRFLLLNGEDYWFVKSYILLMLFSPMINAYIEHTDSKNLFTFLTIFYLTQTIFGWVSIYGISDFQGGYSVLSFIGLYVLGRLLKTYSGEKRFLNLKPKYYFSLFVAIAFLHFSMAILVTLYGLNISGRIFTYTSPLVIFQSVCILLAFTNMKPYFNNIINWVANSCLAVYLFHANSLLLRPYYAKVIRDFFYNNNIYNAFVYTCTTIILIFTISILIDKTRKYIWNKTAVILKTK